MCYPIVLEAYYEKFVLICIINNSLFSILALIMPGTRSQSENMDGKLGAKSAPVDHSYMRSDRSKPSTPSMKALENVIEKCAGCIKTFEKQKKIRCGFCEQPYCYNCSSLTKTAFEAFSTCESVSWRSDLLPQDTAGYRRRPQVTAGYLKYYYRISIYP